MAYGRTVLITETSEPARAALRNALVLQGYRVFDARDLMEAEAVSRGIGGPLHLLVTDVALPDGNGIDLTRKLMRRFPLLRVLFVSAHCDDVLFLDGGMAERVAFLAKPIRLASFVAKVHEAIHTQAATAQVRVRGTYAPLRSPQPDEPPDLARQVAYLRRVSLRLHQQLSNDAERFLHLQREANRIIRELCVAAGHTNSPCFAADCG